MTQIADDAPKAATLKELKAAMPEASSDFIIEQQEKEATIGDALKAYNSHLAAKLKESEEARTAAEGRAKTAEEKTKATTTTEQPKARGHQFGASAGAAQADPAGEPDADYHAMALAYQKKHNCRWNEATLAIKKRYPESRAFFGAPKG